MRPRDRLATETAGHVSAAGWFRAPRGSPAVPECRWTGAGYAARDVHLEKTHVTEVEWPEATDPEPMLELLRSHGRV
jgi:hypothetical protein